MFRDATLGHQLLLALGRVVSTKVYLSAEGVDESVRQGPETWRQKFLQKGIKGTAIVYGNGNVDHAMRSFPPEQEVVQDTFAAVFSGPEKTSGERLTVAEQEELAREALRKEVQFRVDKPLFDRQARRLLETNYVYREHGSYRRDLVDSFPDEPGVPACLLACAKFVPVSATETDLLQARGPSSSTTGAEQELEAAGAEDAAELVRWMSLVDEQQDDVAELTSLPALHGAPSENGKPGGARGRQ